MEVLETAIPDVKVLVPKKWGDRRGFFSETYNRERMHEVGITCEFVQDNHAFSAEPRVLRGLHYQIPPFAQDKLVRVSQGAILDVAVDVRRGSPTFGRHVTVELSAENWKQVFVPVGFAHAYLTLMPDTEVLYKVSNLYAADHERGLLWNDPDIGIDWGLGGAEPVLSDRDKVHPRLSDATDLF
jgi:dTDP-4-dehydrorhamnose 3,5-epimerase